MLKNRLLNPKNIANESHKPLLSPPKSDVSKMKNIEPAKIITFRSNLTLIAPIKTPSSQNAIVVNIKIIYI